MCIRCFNIPEDVYESLLAIAALQWLCKDFTLQKDAMDATTQGMFQEMLPCIEKAIVNKEGKDTLREHYSTCSKSSKAGRASNEQSIGRNNQQG